MSKAPAPPKAAEGLGDRLPALIFKTPKDFDCGLLPSFRSIVKSARMASLLMAAFALSACGETIVARYRFTITVDVDGVLYSGSSIDEISITERPRWQAQLAQGIPLGFGLRAEAVAVRLGSRGTLFVLLDPDSARATSSDHIISLYVKVSSDELYSLSHETPVPISDLPLMVCFGDTSQPNTVRVVVPGDLSPCFGGGARLVSATFGPTDEPLTEDILIKLPWLTKGRDTPYIQPQGRQAIIEFRSFSTRISR